MLQNGFKHVYALKGGWADWTKAGHPVQDRIE